MKPLEEGPPMVKDMLHIDHNIVLELINSVTDSPMECCGFLFGQETGTVRMVSAVMAVVNVSDSDRLRTFAVASADYLRGEAFAEQNNLQMLGVYHSHPGHPATPSEYDRVAAQPYFSYVILSVYDQQVMDIRSWRLNDRSQFEEEIIHPKTHQLYGYCNYSDSAA